MFASMIGLGPHEMTAGLWAFSVGLTVALVLLVPLSIYIAVRATDERHRRTPDLRTNPYPVTVIRADATSSRRRDDRGTTSEGG